MAVLNIMRHATEQIIDSDAAYHLHLIKWGLDYFLQMSATWANLVSQISTVMALNYSQRNKEIESTNATSTTTQKKGLNCQMVSGRRDSAASIACCMGAFGPSEKSSMLKCLPQELGVQPKASNQRKRHLTTAAKAFSAPVAFLLSYTLPHFCIFLFCCLPGCFVSATNQLTVGPPDER